MKIIFGFLPIVLFGLLVLAGPFWIIMATPIVFGFIIWDIIKWHERRAISKAAKELLEYHEKNNIPFPTYEELLKKD